MRIRNKSKLIGHGNSEGRRIVAELLDAGLDAIDPYLRVKNFLKVTDDSIVLDDRGYEMRGDPYAGRAEYKLSDYDRIFVIGAAKGVQRAALAFEEALGDRLTAGTVIDKHGEKIICSKIKVVLAGHPVPDEYCVKGCKEIEKLVADLTEKDLVFTIFGSGCGSLFTYPAGDITIDDVARFTRLMQIEKGVPTDELNRIRTHIDRFKGGRIARLMKRATVVNMTTADPSKTNTPVKRVSYGEMLETNTFFPTLSAASTYRECLDIINKYDAWDRTPQSILDHLSRCDNAENMRREEYEKLNARFFGLIFKDSTVYPAIRKRAEELGFNCVMLCEYEQAEAREAGLVNSAIAVSSERLGEPFGRNTVLMSSGENVVTVGSEKGVGGRNQEYCLAAALNISGSERVVIGAVDTDGTDGPGGFRVEGAPECLAGAIVDGCTLSEAEAAGIDIHKALKTHAASEACWRLDSGIDAVTGVSALDLRIILIL